MNIPKETLETYLPAIEEFLTSVLLEETNIEVEELNEVEKEVSLEHFNDADIYLYTREQNQSSNIIVVLDKEWFGLLSSIMLGIEEKEKNEQTIKLLEEFAGDLSDVVKKQAEKNDLTIELGDIKVLSKEEVEKKLAHETYVWSELGIEGIADDVVRAGFLIGDPETEIEGANEEEEAEDIDENKGEDNFTELSSLEQGDDDDEFTTRESKSEPKERKKENVISARHIEFAEFSEDEANGNGKAHSMDLLKDVELDVSVELGRIELPLGKVLELSKGSVIELEKLAGEPVDLLVNGNRIALGEVVVIDEHFGVRISSLVTTKKRLAKLKNGS